MDKNKLGNVLLLCKKSSYELYFLKHKDSLKKICYFPSERTTVFKKAHEEHYNSLQEIETTLKTLGINYKKVFRGSSTDFGKYNTVITVGGDGTVLESNRNIKKQLLIGINSSPTYSMGRLCVCKTTKKLRSILKKIISGNVKFSYWDRIRVKLKRTKEVFDILNDILICHSNPAAMSRYCLKINSRSEEQRSSGVWISTAVGSSGAIFSAGGKRIDPKLAKFQYMPRELYKKDRSVYILKGGILSFKNSFEIKSLMRTGKIYFDGSHISRKFQFGDKVKVYKSPYSVKTIII